MKGKSITRCYPHVLKNTTLITLAIKKNQNPMMKKNCELAKCYKLEQKPAAKNSLEIDQNW